MRNIQHLETNERKVFVSTDSRITLDSLKNRKNHAHLIDNIRMKEIEMELPNCIIEFTWIKARAGHHGNELADQLAKEAATSRDINVCYKMIPKSTMLRELNDISVIKWQSEWDQTTKGTITKSFFPNIADRLKLKINVTTNFATGVTGHGNIKSCL
jgi:hypothetical protein